MFTSAMKIRVRYSETDQMGTVYHSNFFPYFESARAESIRQLGFTYADMEKTGVVMPVIEVNAKFHRPAFYDELLIVKTLLKELPTNFKIEFHHEVINEKDVLLVTGKVVLYFKDVHTLKPTRMPAALLEKLKPYFN